MPTRNVLELLKQLFKRPATNPFPSKFAPGSAVRFLEGGKMNPSVPVPDDFRGKLEYDVDKCIGCGACEKVCPANAIEMVGEQPKRKIVHYVGRCAFCAQCVDVCPVKCLHMGKEFLLATRDNYSKEMVVGPIPKQGRKKGRK